MRFDDLILAEDEYPQGACENRQEWLLMYSRGVQNDSAEARVLYRWLENQRHSHDACRLAQDKIEALDRLGEWVGTRKGNPEESWEVRLEEARQFKAETGRFPIYDPQRRPDEKVLAVWLGRQRTWQRKGRLRPDRHESLDQLVPGWNSSRSDVTAPVIGLEITTDSSACDTHLYG